MDYYVSFFYKLRWPDGFHCPRCAYPEAYTITGRTLPLYQCKLCRHQTTVTAGTIMESSRTPLSKWASAIELLSHHKSVNAVQLAKIISVTYKTAWSILRKIRSAILQFDQNQRLTGSVEAGVRFYGRRNWQMFTPHPQEHPVIVAGSYFHNSNLTYVKMKFVPSAYMESKSVTRAGIASFRAKHVSEEAMYSFQKRIPFRSNLLLRDIFAEAKSWINRTFRGIGKKYLDAYLAEFCFRVNATIKRWEPLSFIAELCMSTSKINIAMNKAA